MRFKTLKLFVVILLMTIFGVSHATCVGISGVILEKIGKKRILVKSNGKNTAIIEVFAPQPPYETIPRDLPSQIKEYRFFSNKICTYGAESIFSLNGSDWEITKIRKFSN